MWLFVFHDATQQQTKLIHTHIHTHTHTQPLSFSHFLPFYPFPFCPSPLMTLTHSLDPPPSPHRWQWHLLWAIRSCLAPGASTRAGLPRTSLWRHGGSAFWKPSPRRRMQRRTGLASRRRPRQRYGGVGPGHTPVTLQ
jgi:hypothetical protein